MKKNKKQNPIEAVRKCVQSGKCKSPKACMEKKKCSLEGKPGKRGQYGY